MSPGAVAGIAAGFFVLGLAIGAGLHKAVDLVPERPLTEVLKERAARIADAQLASADQTMRLEAQGVPGQQNEARASLIGQLLRKPSRLWDDP